MKLRARLGVLILIPVMAFLATVALDMSQLVQQRQTAAKVLDAFDLASAASNVVHTLQVERGVDLVGKTEPS